MVAAREVTCGVAVCIFVCVDNYRTEPVCAVGDECGVLSDIGFKRFIVRLLIEILRAVVGTVADIVQNRAAAIAGGCKGGIRCRIYEEEGFVASAACFEGEFPEKIEIVDASLFGA